MAEEPKDPTKEYDAKHGKPGSEPEDRGVTDDQKWGLRQNPVRESPLAGTGLRSVGK
jgi:hypothetical protein